MLWSLSDFAKGLQRRPEDQKSLTDLSLRSSCAVTLRTFVFLSPREVPRARRLTSLDLRNMELDDS